MVLQALVTPHPHTKDMPQIDYTLALGMTPSLMLGLALGVLVNAVIAQWLLNLLIISVWTWSSIRLCFSYRAARQKEQQHKQQQQQQVQEEPHITLAHSLEDQAKAAAITREPAALMVQCDSSSTDHTSTAAAAATTPARDSSACNRAALLLSRAAEAGRHWVSIQPWWTICSVSVLFGIFIAAQLLKGAVMRACSPGYWATFGAVCVVSVAATIAVSWWLWRASQYAAHTLPTARHAAAGTCGKADAAAAVSAAATLDSPLRSVVHWTWGMLAKIHAQMVIAGLMLGAWPLSPIILAIPNMHPQVGAGTSKLMLFMITGGAALSFIASGSINLSYMLVYGVVNAVATPIGVWVVDWAIKRTGRASCIIMLTIVRLAACVVLQAALQAVPSLIALAHGLPRAGFMPHPLCGAQTH